MRPEFIIQRLDLLRPIYRPTAAYGHFGRPEFPWEAADRVGRAAKRPVVTAIAARRMG